MTQNDLAKKASVTLDTVRGWESGDHKPTRMNFDELSKAFEIPVEQLWEAAVLLVPEFDIGVYFFPAPPVPAREALVIEPIMRKLRAQSFDRYLIYTFQDLREELESRFLRNSSALHYKSLLLDWAREKKRALVLCGFRSLDEENWKRYIETIGWLKYDCCIVVIQAIDPFHVQPLFNAGSQYVAKTQDVQMTVEDYRPALEDLRSEMPACCIRAIRALLDERLEAEHRESVGKLIEAKILARRKDRLVLTYGTEDAWRELAER